MHAIRESRNGPCLGEPAGGCRRTAGRSTRHRGEQFDPGLRHLRGGGLRTHAGMPSNHDGTAADEREQSDVQKNDSNEQFCEGEAASVGELHATMIWPQRVPPA